MKRKTTRTAGFTLMEMLLVIGLIAVFASMTLPSALRIYGRRKLTESAERVRAVAASARVHAIESGLVYQFCCEANGGHFAVVPFEPDHVSSGGNGQGGGGGGQNMGMGLLHRVSGHLPAGVIFTSNVMGIGGNVISTGGTQKISPTALEGLPNAGDLSSLNWSAPILFNADGSANADAHITVSDSHSQHILLRVRAFTGAVSMERLSAGKRK